MGLVQIQHEFLQHVTQLIQVAGWSGFVVTAGEVYRTKEQQQIYFDRGMTTTMNSQHMKRLAIDLNFFKVDGGSYALTYDKEDLQEIGDYWESMHPGNKWGGNWTSFLDTCHFERREE